MTLTLLLDLDDTLLTNHMDTFLPRYLSLFSQQVEQSIPADVFIKTLLIGTHAMSENRRPDQTLKETFEKAFYPRVGIDPVQFQLVADHFYTDSFPALRGITKPVEGAEQVVRKALDRGYRIAIATNPLFPKSAINQRLAWANLDPKKFAFHEITSYENYHFAKPEPAYYAEILANLGWPDGPVVMVGDDLQRDIDPANRLGLATYWVPPEGQFVEDSRVKPGMSGPLSGIFDWLDRTPEKDLSPGYDTPSSILAVMRSTPAVIDSLCRDLTAETWLHKPGDDEWSLTEVLCHLRDVEKELNIPRFEKLLKEENPFIAGRDSDRWASERQYIKQNGVEACSAYLAARVRLLDILEAMDADSWNKPARHAIFGPIHLVELAKITAAHDRLHVQQIQKTIKSAQLYKNDVRN